MFLPTLIMLPFLAVTFLFAVYGVGSSAVVTPVIVIAAEVSFLAVVTALIATKGKKLYEKL